MYGSPKFDCDLIQLVKEVLVHKKDAIRGRDTTVPSNGLSTEETDESATKAERVVIP